MKLFLCWLLLLLPLEMSSTEFKLKIDIRPNLIKKIEIKAIREPLQASRLTYVTNTIIHSEGCRLKPYRCPTQAKTGKGFTIGYGRVVRDQEQYLLQGITQYQADSLLHSDVKNIFNIVKREFTKDSLTVSQLEALTRVTYAIGLGNLKKSILYTKIKSKNLVLEDDFTKLSFGYTRNALHLKLDYLKYNN